VEGDVVGVHDPAIIKEGDTLYLFTTTPPDSKTPDQFPILCSKDLTHWKACGYVFSEIPTGIKQLSPKTKELWAPDISFFDGKFHQYYAYSASGVNTSRIALLTNKTLNPQSPDYHWADEGLVLQRVPRTTFSAIDANLILNEKGQAWLSFSSFPERRRLSVPVTLRRPQLRIVRRCFQRRAAQLHCFVIVSGTERRRDRRNVALRTLRKAAEWQANRRTASPRILRITIENSRKSFHLCEHRILHPGNRLQLGV
jgi:glycosyl hydrolase family 43